MRWIGGRVSADDVEGQRDELKHMVRELAGLEQEWEWPGGDERWQPGVDNIRKGEGQEAALQHRELN